MRDAGPTATIRPPSTRTAPSEIGGAVTGWTVPARRRSTIAYGETPVPNGACTGHTWVGSVPGKNHSQRRTSSGQNGDARYPVEPSTSRVTSESGRGQSEGGGRRA